ncbi:vWA domain-containing protein [Methylobacter sp. YRD-M1]|uniref:vWA domain-containing protein n=1 Tax=Methylobacter sp. YRD-M1 TaxID=2911520 RepID=UPI00227B05FF|nr:VWA domain-containing protein [Methylobacter sp. YRD-M1]WAK02181.1 VWA domain-containing protein [Methylobacter sp. YRD-M1]
MNLAEFHFIRPYWLLALIPYGVLLVLMLRSKLRQGNWSAVCDTALLPYLLQEKAVGQSRWPLTASAVGAFLAIIALAGPSWERQPAPVFRNDSALVIALDLSLSMDAADIKPSRLTRARYKIADILKQRKDGQTALLVYASDAFTVTPLTDDTETIASQLEALNTNIMPSQGSNTAVVLGKAQELFRQAGLQKGQLLLVTDGVDVDETLPAVKSLGSYQLSILGVGTSEGAPVALPDGGFLKDEQGDIVVTKLNTDELAKLAQAGHGIFQSITADDSDVDTLLAALDKPVRQQGAEKKEGLLDQWQDRGPWILLLVLPLAALTFRKGILYGVLLLLVPLPKNSYALDWQDLWHTKDQQAQQAFQKGDFGKAAQLFENPDWKAAAHYKAGQYNEALASPSSAGTADSFYNQGNALAKTGQLAEALKAYEQALKINPNDKDTQYNKEIVEKALKEQKQDQQQQQDDKQQQSKDDSQQKKDSDQSDQAGDQQKQGNESDQQPSDKQQQSKDQQQQNKPEQKQQDAEKSQQPGQQHKDDAQQQAAQQSEQSPAETKDETAQANEQWLNRIPDDPAGLLKRKFLYQYGQRERQSGSRSRSGSGAVW